MTLPVDRIAGVGDLSRKPLDDLRHDALGILGLQSFNESLMHFGIRPSAV